MDVPDLVNPLLNESGVSNAPATDEADITLPFASTDITGIKVDDPYVPAVTPLLAKVNAPVEESVPSEDMVTKVGTEDALTTKICPPVPVKDDTGFVPLPIKIPF